jgi:hypothetical protein
VFKQFAPLIPKKIQALFQKKSKSKRDWFFIGMLAICSVVMVKYVLVAGVMRWLSSEE